MNLDRLQSIPPWEWPEDATQSILSVLRDRTADPSDRLLAAELAGEVPPAEDELALALLAIVANDGESESLRGRAAIALGPSLEFADTEGFDDTDPDDSEFSESSYDEIQETFHRLYHDGAVPEHVRRMVLESSVRAPEDWHTDAVRGAYYSKEEAWQLTAVFCMQYLQGFDGQILESLDSDNPDIVYHAVSAAGNAEIDAAWPRVISLLQAPDTDKDLRLAAIEACAWIRPEEAPDVLGEWLDSDDEEIVEAVHEALDMTGEFEDDDDDEDDVDFDDDEDDDEGDDGRFVR